MTLGQVQVSGMDPLEICFLWNNGEFRGFILLSCGILQVSTGACVDDF